MLRSMTTICLMTMCSMDSPRSLAQDSSDAADLWPQLQRSSPWVFLGDSNTYAGGYVAILDAWLRATLPEGERPKLLNLGVPSETASGLSEVDHPFKRPCIHERLEKVLAMTRPGVVFICYGMNDGIYQPPNQENLRAYQEGMMRLAQAVHDCGAVLICLTPPIFEPKAVQMKGKFGPTEAGRYAYFAPAADYDKSLEQQSQWCLQNSLMAAKVIDIHSLLHTYAVKQKETEPNFLFSRDGIHFNNLAHALIAEKVLQELGAPRAILDGYPSDAQITHSTRSCQILRDSYLSATGKNRPGLAAGLPVWHAEQIVARMSAGPSLGDAP